MAPPRITVRGSFAQGTFSPRSDVDVLVVRGGNLPHHMPERIQVLPEASDTRAPIEPLGYTTDQFVDMLRRRHVTALDPLRSGISLHGTAHFTKLRERFHRVVEQALQRTKCTRTMSES